MRTHRLIITAAVMVLASASWAGAAGPPFELSVKKDQLIGASRGTLRFTEDGVQYDTSEKTDARTWVYGDIKQLQVLSPTRIVVLTYEDQGRLKLGADRTFTFDVVTGSVSPELVAFLLARVEHPLVTAVRPPGAGPVLFRLSVKHQRSGRGSEGALVMYEDHLAYLTERETDARSWRFSDIFAVLPLDRFRLQVQAYEGGSGRTRTFVFELKSALPPEFYDALWARVNPSALDRRTAPAPSPFLPADAFVRVARERARSVVALHTLTETPLVSWTPNGQPGSEGPPIVDQGLGSGVVIDSEGFILTNAHVIEGATAIHVRTDDGDDIDVVVVGRDPDTDLALLKVADPSALEPAPFGDSNRVQPGQWVVAIGSPFGLHHTVTAGILSATARGDGSGLDFLQTDAAVNPGNSGGPLLDLNGNVIGIAAGIVSEMGQNIGLNFAIPINTVKEVLPQLRRGNVVHGSLGIDTRTLTRAAARFLGLEASEALQVTAVDPEGPAARAGIEVGDALLGLTAPRTATARDLRREVWRTPPGTAIRIQTWRRGVFSEVPAVVGQRPGAT